MATSNITNLSRREYSGEPLNDELEDDGIEVITGEVEPLPGYTHPRELDGWDYRLDNDRVTVLCAYNPVTEEARVNNDYPNNLAELQEDLEDRPGCLLQLLTLGGARGSLDEKFTIRVMGRYYEFDSRLVKAGILRLGQRILIPMNIKETGGTE